MENRNSQPLGASLVAGAHFANDALTSMLPALLPLLGMRFELATSQIALLVSVFAVSTSLPQPFFGSLSDRWGGHLIGAIGLAGSAALLVALSAAPSVAWLYVLLAVGGLGSAALHPAGTALSRAASSANPGLAIGLFTAAGMAGGASGPVLALGITSGFGFQGLAWAALPALLVAALLFKFAPRAPAPVTSPVLARRVGLQLLRGHVGRLAFVALCANLAVLTLTCAVPVWLVRERGLAEDSPVISLTLAVFSLAAAAGGILGGVLVRFLSRSRLVVLSLAFALLALEIVLVTTPGSAPYFISVAAAGALLFVQSPLVTVRAQELSPGAESAVAGVLLGGTSAAAALVYAALGAAQSAFGTGTVMAVTFLALVPAVHVAMAAFGVTDSAPAEHQPSRPAACCGCFVPQAA